MKISLSLLTVGMIAVAATAADHSISDIILNYTGNGLHQDNGQAYVAFKARTVVQKNALTGALYSTDFDAYKTGVICTDMTGTIMGQDRWSQYQTGTGNRWSIVSVAGGKAVQGTWGSASAAGSYSYLWQDNGQTGYSAFTTDRGVHVSFDLTRYSNTVSTNKGQTQLRTYDVSGTQTTMGFIMDNYATGTMTSIRGLAYLNTGVATTSGTYAFTLATGSAVTQAGTHKYYTAYDNITGLVYWGWDVGLATENNFYFDPTLRGYIGAANQVAVDEIDFLNNRNSSTTAGSMNIDNIAIYLDGLDETFADCNGNGVPDRFEGLPDCNNNNMLDVCEIALGLAKDCNNNGIPDYCEILNEDFDRSGSIDSGDLGLMLLDFGTCIGCLTDINGSGEVDGADIGLLLLDLGACS